jgi:VWFA-related protein
MCCTGRRASGEREFVLVKTKILRNTVCALSTLAALLLAFATLATAPLSAQEPPSAPLPKQDAGPPPPPITQPPQTETQAKIVKNVNLVVLPVTVKDSAGRLVPDLTQDEFRVYDDNVQQRIEIFSVEAFPLSVVVLLDNDLKTKDADEVQESLRAILAGMSLADEADICRFDTYFHPGSGFTRDQDKLLTELKRIRINESPDQQASVSPPSEPYNGPTLNGGQSVVGGGAPAIPSSTRVIGEHSTKAIDDAVYGAAELLKDRGRERRKIIFLISDGVNSKFNENAYENVVRELLRYNISVYSIGVGNAGYNRYFSRLKSYANDTGGDIYYAAKRERLEGLYAKIAEEARNTYTLAYAPQGNDRTKEYHSVEVRVLRPNLNIKTREGYFSGALPQ